MMRILTLLALMVTISVAFYPASAPRRQFGITTTTTTTITVTVTGTRRTSRTATSRIAASAASSSSSVDKNSFEGIDLEKLLGTKKYKKTMKKLKRKANQRDDSNNNNMKQEKTQLQAATTPSSSTPDESNGRKGLKLLICGAPAAGKGTQCAFIKETFGLVHLSTGDMLRAAVADQTPVGIMAKDFMDSGKLVPDEVIIGIVKDRLEQEDCQTNGWLLDGFPRTQAQAAALADAGIAGDCFIMLNVPTDVLVERVVGRRTDPETGDIYHMTFSPPPLDNPDIMARLVQRSDDTEEKVKVRLEQYHANVEAVKGSYSDIIVEIDGLGKPEQVFKAIEIAVKTRVSV